VVGPNRPNWPSPAAPTPVVQAAASKRGEVRNEGSRGCGADFDGKFGDNSGRGRGVITAMRVRQVGDGFGKTPPPPPPPPPPAMGVTNTDSRPGGGYPKRLSRSSLRAIFPGEFVECGNRARRAAASGVWSPGRERSRRRIQHAARKAGGDSPLEPGGGQKAIFCCGCPAQALGRARRARLAGRAACTFSVTVLHGIRGSGPGIRSDPPRPDMPGVVGYRAAGATSSWTPLGTRAR